MLGFNWETLQLQIDTLKSVVVAMVLCSPIGLEREKANRTAGLRTHLLVAGATAAIVSLGSIVLTNMTSSLGAAFEEEFNADPLRVIEAVVAGVSFIGAGTIIQRKQGDVDGITTAATLLYTAAIGIACGGGALWLAMGMSVIGILVNTLLRKFEQTWNHSTK